MFHKGFTCEEDRNSQRFLCSDGDLDQKPDVYEMLFGAISSPASAISVKQLNADLWAKELLEAGRALK